MRLQCFYSVSILIIVTNARSLPILQPDLFVISGVTTCDKGNGYCLLGADCAVNKDFRVDDDGGHCDGLEMAFTEQTKFVCCRYFGDNSTFDNGIEAIDDSLPPTSILHVNDNSTTSNKSDTKDEIMENDDDIDQNMNVVNSTDKLIDINHLGCPDLSEKMENFDNQSVVKFEEGDDNRSSVIEPREQALPPLEIEETIEKSNISSLSAPSQYFTDNSRSLPSNETMQNSNCIFYEEESSSSPQYVGDTTTQTIHIPVDMRSDFKGSVNEKFDKNRCHNFSTEMADKCVNIWKFVSNGKIICFGTLVNSVWLLTSASCITRIFENGINKARVTDVNDNSGTYGISNMIVHENFKKERLQDINDIGLVSLDRVASSSCSVCIPIQEKKYANSSCTTYAMAKDANNRETMDKCENRLKALNMYSKMYLTLPCSNNEQRTLEVNDRMANALWCENTLVGVGISTEKDAFVFTPIVEYTDWIQQNIQLYA